ncbi:Crp/Fnr family transcriptional regulator [Oceanomicrobium pacificus]|uniref:Helix-turn-helix domain-containing protein n=1 Tax=Oceanomicrobium pacificus TaxID=2692916 RepID=A0A6B0TYR0_9RHOB|nr:Crp/Fnr family transcriptional regulator [Oceanomicrobium pacificus]MXU66558.1 helix-turn-helix domain-containing protein [Oceanomicrobium pacificus]
MPAPPRLDPSLIRQLAPFAGLDRAALDSILASATPLHYEPGDTIFAQAEAASRFFLLLDGHIRVVRVTPDGDQVVARYIAAGQLFGIAPALGMDRFPASAEAADPCLALAWPRAKWAEFTSRYPGFAQAAGGTIGTRLMETNDRVVELATQQVEQRVAQAVLRLVNQSGRKVRGGIEIDFPISRQDLADMTGTTLHTVSRLLSRWEKDGIVESGRLRITVTNPHALVLISEARAADG